MKPIIPTSIGQALAFQRRIERLRQRIEGHSNARKSAREHWQTSADAMEEGVEIFRHRARAFLLGDTPPQKPEPKQAQA